MEVGEVLPFADDIALSNIEEERVAQYGHDEEDEHEKDEHVDERGNGHLNGLQERPQVTKLVCQAQDATDSQDAQHTCELRTNSQNLALGLLIVASLLCR